MSKLHISDDLQLPRDFVTQTQAILAKRGKGKTYAAHVQAEELTKAGLPWVAIDGVGVWYGLRAGKSGTKAGGLPVLVLGGEHGDLSLEPGAGEVVADFVVKERQPTVLDVSEFSNRKMIDFVAGFVEALYRLNRDALHVFVEEADMFAPQVARYPGEELTLGAIDKMVRRGRQRGLGSTLISQRPAVIHKGPLTQTEMMTVLGFTSPQDIAAISDWFKAHGIVGEQLADVLHTLPSLGREVKGEAWVSSPEWLNFFGKVRYRAKETFDSSATPKPGAPNARPRSLADVPLADLHGRMKEYAEQKKANDPGALRKRIIELEKQLAVRPAEQKIVEKVVEKEVPVLKNGQLDRTEKHVARLEAIAEKVFEESAELRRLITPACAPRPVPAAPRPAAVATAVRPVPRRQISMPTGQGEALPKAERRILAALAQYPEWRTIKQVAVLTGYAMNGGGFRNALGALRSKSYIVDTPGLIAITDAGAEALGEYEPLPHGDALLQHWYGQLGKAEREILEVVASAHPDALSIEEVAQRTPSQYAPGGGGFRNALGRLRTLELIEGRSEVRASDELFG